MTQLAIDLYTEIAMAAIPFSLVFSICNYIVTTYLTAAFGGKLKI